MGALRFTKVEGVGNDYVLVDAFEQVVPDPSGLARAVADRHTGIGSDGLLLVGPGPDDADASMRIFNADGSEGLMCGNGLRCVMRWLQTSGRATGENVLVATASGLRRGHVGNEGSIEVEMGRPTFEPESLPVRADGDPPEVPLPEGLAADPDVGFCVAVGNPHVVVSVADPEAVDLGQIGPPLERSERFPEGVNVHVVGRARAASSILVARTWERGSGATQACGTGAVAVAAVARRLGWVDGDVTTVLMPGGPLTVTWDGTEPARLSGAARLVFTGDWPCS